MKIVFSREASIDAALMNREGIRLFGVQQAKAYQAGFREALRLIEAFPEASPIRIYDDTAVRVRRYGSHMIIYAIRQEVIEILRIRHGREDWQDE